MDEERNLCGGPYLAGNTPTTYVVRLLLLWYGVCCYGFPPPPSQDQYKLCHEALLSYVDTFDTYANFNETAKV